MAKSLRERVEKLEAAITPSPADLSDSQLESRVIEGLRADVARGDLSGVRELKMIMGQAWNLRGTSILERLDLTEADL